MLILVLTMLLVIGFAFGKTRLAEFVLLTRSFGDPIFNLSKLPEMGRAEMGVGAALNIVVIALAASFLLTRPRVKILGPVALWTPFLAATLIAVPVAPEPSVALRFFLVLVSHAAFFLMPFYMINGPHDARRLCLIILASAVIPSVAGMAQIALGPADTDDGTRIASTFTHPNIFAYYILVVIATCLLLAYGSNFGMSRHWRRALHVGVPILLLLLLMTKTRSAWLSCALLIGISAVLFDRRYLLYFAAAPLVLVTVPEVGDRLADLSQGNYYESYAKLNSYAWRELLWQSAMRWVVERPMLGHGLESFGVYVAEFFPIPLANGTTDSHNVFVQLLFETGIVGLLAFLWLIVGVAGWLLRTAARCPGNLILVGLIFAYSIMAYADNMLYYLTPNWYFWFLLGSGCALSRMTAAATPEAQSWPTFLTDPPGDEPAGLRKRPVAPVRRRAF